MCGIVAQYGRLDPEEAERMLSRLIHRGPDDEGTALVGGDAWLGHRRLSIVDVSGGKQPLSTSRGELSLVGNGEIYNHEEIRGTLSGGEFSTGSDNEVALHLVAERGPDALKDLLGMYAFVVAGEDGSFVAARDPVGIKPLYWARRDGRTVFVSELGAFDEDWLGEVDALPHGHYWTPEGGAGGYEPQSPRKTGP